MIIELRKDMIIKVSKGEKYYPDGKTYYFITSYCNRIETVIRLDEETYNYLKHRMRYVK